MAPLGAVLARAFGARLIVQAHGVEAWTRPSGLLRLAVERADMILAVSRDTRARLLDWAAIEPEQVRVASNTVAEDFTPGDGLPARAGLGLSDEFVILTVGRLAASERYKGHDRVIRLLKCLMESGSDPGLPDRRRWRRSREARSPGARVGVRKQVRFLGHVPREISARSLSRRATLSPAFIGRGIWHRASSKPWPAARRPSACARGGAIDALGDGELGVALEEDDLRVGLLRACRDLRAGRLETGETLAHHVVERFGQVAFQRRVSAVFAEDHLN